MNNNIINTKNNNQSGVVKVSHDAASYYADLAKKWATKTDDKVDGSEYSAKFYANQAKKQAESMQETIDSANDLIDGIETTKTEINELKENSVTAIQAEKDNAVSAIETSKTTAVAAVETVKTQASNDLENEKEKAIKEVQNLSDIKIATTEQAGLVKPDGETITINEEGIISSAATSGGGGSWGSIIGTLADQTDLMEEFAKYVKIDSSNGNSSDSLSITHVGLDFWTDEDQQNYAEWLEKGHLEDLYPMHTVTGDIIFSNGFAILFGNSTLRAYDSENDKYNEGFAESCIPFINGKNKTFTLSQNFLNNAAESKWGAYNGKRVVFITPIANDAYKACTTGNWQPNIIYMDSYIPFTLTVRNWETFPVRVSWVVFCEIDGVESGWV